MFSITSFSLYLKVFSLENSLKLDLGYMTKGVSPKTRYTSAYAASSYCFASELKVLYNLVNNKSLINNFIPGNFMTITNKESPYYNIEKYTSFPCSNNNYFIDSNNEVFLNIVLKLSNAVKKKLLPDEFAIGKIKDRLIRIIIKIIHTKMLLGAFILNNSNKEYPNMLTKII